MRQHEGWLFLTILLAAISFKQGDVEASEEFRRRIVSTRAEPGDHGAVPLARLAESDGLPESLHRAVRQFNNNNRIELLMVVDKAAYDKFVARNSGNTTAALLEIERYYAGIAVQVNERLAKLDQVDQPGPILQIILVQIRVWTTAAESQVTVSLNNGSGIINSDVALINFRTIAISLQAVQPHDYAILITGFDLYRPTGADTRGITFQSGMCTASSQGIMEDGGGEVTASILAHTLGHAMNATHDDMVNTCTDVFFIMTPAEVYTPSSRAFAGNPFDWSTCSKQEIRDFLSRTAASCLRIRQSVPGREVNLTALTATELGQQYNADAQCRNVYGSFSRFCRNDYLQSPNFRFEDDMCYNLRCRQLNTATCLNTLAFDGTTCGNGRWCQDGRCVADARAPNTPTPTCPQGDDPTVTCTEASCAVDIVRRGVCCATCAQIGPTRPTPPVSVAGLTTSTIAPTGARTFSIAGQTRTTPGPTPPSPGRTFSIYGQSPTTPLPPTGQPTLSIFAQTPATPPGPTSQTGPTLSIAGRTPATPPGPTGPTLSIAGQTQPVGPTTPAGPTLSIAGRTPGPTQGPTGPTISINGQTPPPVPPTGPTISIATGGGPNPTAAPTTPGTTYSIAGGVIVGDPPTTPGGPVIIP